MKKSIAAVSTFCFCVVAAAQPAILKKQVFDRDTKMPIPYATIQIANTLKYSDSDDKGIFEIEASNNDSLLITCIGYKSSKIPVVVSQKNDSLFLDKEVVQLRELIVSKPVINTFGIIDDNKNTSSTGGSQAGRHEMATLIEIPATIKMYRITKVLLKARNFKEENPVRLHIYSVDSLGLPGQELLTKEIVITNDQVDNKIVSIDVKDQQIVLENSSFFVGIQWLTSTKVKLFTGPEVFETFKEKKLLTYRRSLTVNKNKWFGWFDKRSVIFYPGGETPNDEKPINMLTSAEIEILSN